MKLSEEGMALELELRREKGKVVLTVYAKQGTARLRMSERPFDTEEQAWVKIRWFAGKRIEELGLEGV